MEQKELEAVKNLLARIHGDGGHYTEKHGLLKSIIDAEWKVYIKGLQRHHRLLYITTTQAEELNNGTSKKN